ncbi:hypothetical protein [Amycolatopsis anabasis]|uniref:hypothetical protein n=1 Tax=Amycolatopsis anabasis TaxID=1840409 RepID=UPI00131D8756|nr:hypothetical protein [Amycolatopsis anabasis]
MIVQDTSAHLVPLGDRAAERQSIPLPVGELDLQRRSRRRLDGILDRALNRASFIRGRPSEPLDDGRVPRLALQGEQWMSGRHGGSTVNSWFGGVPNRLGFMRMHSAA